LRLATITINGTLDRVILVPGLAPGEIHDSGDIVTLPSGKGLNVARTARALGGELMTTGLVAGQCGQWICALLEEEGIPQRFISLSGGESRISTIVVDLDSRQTTVINDLGPSAPPGVWPEIRSQLSEAVRGYPWVALCGSSLPGLPVSVYADLCREIQSRGQRVCLDTRGEWLTSALSARPYLVKCNQFEVSQVLGCPVHTPEQARDAARRWVGQGVDRVVITLGDRGAVAVERGAAWYVQAPRVKVLCPIGSGDAMMAGLLFALDRGDPLPVAVQHGVAFGAANALVPGSGRCDLDAVPGLLLQAAVHSI
jgi:tagatose 6-phosphate kinase